MSNIFVTIHSTVVDKMLLVKLDFFLNLVKILQKVKVADFSPKNSNIQSY